MPSVSNLFSIPDTSLLLVGEYNLSLVLLSVAIAVFASFMGFQVATQAANAKTRRGRRGRLAVGAFAQGSGIWSMHFIGMLAFELCTPVSYTWFTTLLSMLPGIAAAWVALNLLTQHSINNKQIVIGGVLVGAGIGAMHYIGMAAMDMAPLLRYDLSTFLLSVVVAVVLAMISLWVRHGLQRLLHNRLTTFTTNILAGAVMGCAISAMHYTGMAAARFVSPPGLELSDQPSEMSFYLAASVTFIASIMIALVLGISLLVKYREASADARRSQVRMISLMESAVEGILTINDEGIIQTVNEAVTTILGWQRMELVGTPLTKFLPEDRRHLYSYRFFKYAEEPEGIQLIGNSRDVEAFNRDGKLVPLRMSLSHTQVAGESLFILFIADISERLAMEKVIRENELKFRSLIANIPGIAYRCLNKHDWPMVFISDAVKKITGYDPDEFLLPDPTVSFVDLFHPDDLDTIEQALVGQTEYSMEYRIFNKAGEIRWLREHGRYIRDDYNEILWLDGFIMDITDRRQMEDDLLIAKDAAEQAAAARAAFLANMSHEIRTPMNAVIGFSDILLDTPLNTEQHKHLSTINRSARSLLHLLNDILDSAKLDKGKLELELVDFILSEEIDTVISTFWLEAKRKGLDLQVKLGDNLAQGYRGAPERIRQVLSNLIGNAVKFTESGQVSLRVNQVNDDHVQFTITDTGIGMTQEQCQRVFDAFAQADASMSRRFGGTGLGTTISKQLVELMGGSIEVRSKPGEGTQFSFILPLTAIDSTSHVQRLHAIQLPALRILIVDDIEQNIELLNLLLKRGGHSVDIGRDGQQALEQMAQHQYDVVLMDLQMPVLDGLTAARQRREYEKANGLKATPIIALTASVLAQDKKSASEAGMEGFANKPIDFPVLCNEIARVLAIQGSALAIRAEPKEALLVDWSRGESLWGSKHKLVKEIKRFCNDITLARETFESLTEQQDFAELKALVHRFKGVAGNLGLIKIMHACKAIEQDCYDKVAPADSVADLYNLVPAVQSAVATEQDNDLQQSAEVDSQELRAILERITHSVKNNRIEEVELALLGGYQNSCFANDIQAVLDAIEDFEFEQAITLLSALIDKLDE
ncbi:MAG: PAS domain S-box protein [Alteromonadaceae bacterium TMED7]|nr:histidine kinase [Alteromonadaceae bacterium]RPH20784.1 MAG: PAS domain S-box protein [Alteromonadaceae bacterium TMED7]